MSTLAEVTILITSFLRDGYLKECLAGLRGNIPECHIIIADDSIPENVHTPEVQVERPEDNVTWIGMSFDSGLSAKRNAGVRACKTKYLLLGCDDFDFSTKEARTGILKLISALDEFANLSVAGGRVDNRPYEGFLHYDRGNCIRETRLPVDDLGDGYIGLCDITVNYFLGRTEVMKQFPWPEEMKIGGEHVCFFLDLKLAGRKVAFVKGANITTLKLGPEAQHPDYAKYRQRALTLGHPLMLQRYGVKYYIGF
jgi:hypothetical protein